MKIKQVFVKRVKANVFKIGDLILKWDAKYEDKGKHGKFDNLWKGPFRVSTFLGNNSFFLTYL